MKKLFLLKTAKSSSELLTNHTHACKQLWDGSGHQRMFTAMLCGSLYCYSIPFAWCHPRSLSCIPSSYSDVVKELWAWVEAEPRTALLYHQVPHCPGSGSYNSWWTALCRYLVRCTWTVIWHQPLTLTPIPGTLPELRSVNKDANCYDPSDVLTRPRLVKTRHVTKYA